MKPGANWARLSGLLLLAVAFTVQAAKPVDNDGDGYRDNRDCNDNDPTVWVLNSCGECAVEPLEGCYGPSCTDGDGDGYALEGGDCGPIDCDDGDRSAFCALHDINLTIADQEFMVLLGASGCGKTTLLRIICGLETATTGEVWIGGRRVDHLPPKDRGIAMVFQNYALYPHKTVAANMGFALKMQRMEKAEIDQRVATAADILGLKPYIKR